MADRSPPPSAPDTLVIMKVGVQFGESFESILSRKRGEIAETGRTYWGYGGSACHPTRQVQPFAAARGVEWAALVATPSPLAGDGHVSNELSSDGRNWTRAPPGIRVTGSKFALVGDAIAEVDWPIALGQYQIGIGPSAGRSAAEYIRFRVDKACVVRDPQGSQRDPSQLHATLAIHLVSPFAVLTR